MIMIKTLGKKKQLGGWQSSEPIKTRSKYVWLIKSAGNPVQASYRLILFKLWLVKKVARISSNQSQNKSKTNVFANNFRHSKDIALQSVLIEVVFTEKRKKILWFSWFYRERVSFAWCWLGRLVSHLFPAPYHRQSFEARMSGGIRQVVCCRENGLEIRQECRVRPARDVWGVHQSETTHLYTVPG